MEIRKRKKNVIPPKDGFWVGAQRIKSASVRIPRLRLNRRNKPLSNSEMTTAAIKKPA